MNEQLVSIIIPIYNGEKYVEKLVDTLNKQVYKNLEIIIVNDGSTDQTEQLLKKMTLSDKKYYIYTKVNGGAASARNYGIERSTGKYIAFIDADDYIFPEYISYLYKLLIDNDADMSCCSYYKMWDSEAMPFFQEDDEIIVFNNKEALLDMLYRKHIVGGPYLKLYCAEIVKKIDYPTDIVYGEDMIFTFNALKQCDCVVYGSKIKYIYYQHTTSVTHAKLINYSEYKKSWDKHKKEILEYAEKEEPQFSNAANAKCFILAIDYCCRIWKCQDKEARVFLKELREFMKRVDWEVFHDEKSKKLNKILALLSCIDNWLLIQICRIYINFKNTFKFETRKSV